MATRVALGVRLLHVSQSKLIYNFNKREIAPSTESLRDVCEGKFHLFLIHMLRLVVCLSPHEIEFLLITIFEHHLRLDDSFAP
jgi:hypothetical protein